MTFFKTLIAAVTLALTTSGAMATPINPPYDLLVTATSTAGGPLDGQTAAGAVFWTQALVPTIGYATLSRSGFGGSIVDPILGLFFDVGPVDPVTGLPLYTFTEADDDLGPLFTFLDGVLQTISYIVMDAFSPADLSLVGVNLFTFDTTTPVGFDGTTISVNAVVKYLAPVPLPAGLPLLAGALGLMAFVRRRRPAPQSV